MYDVFIFRHCSPENPDLLKVYYQHFKLECRMTSKDTYLIWIVHHTGCIVFQKTKKQDYHCFFNVLTEKGFSVMKFSASFKPIFAQRTFYSHYTIHLYSEQHYHTARYAIIRTTPDITELETTEWNCTKITIYEYESITPIQTMFYQMKLDIHPETYPQYTLSKNVTTLLSTATFAFIRMLVDVSVPLLRLHLEVVDPFKVEPYNIYYISLNVTQCQKNSPGMILVLTGKKVYYHHAYYRDTYKLLSPATILPIIKVPFQYLDINLYYLRREAVSCIVNIEYRYYRFPLLDNSRFIPLTGGGPCKYLVSDN